MYGLLRADASPAVATIAATLGCDPKGRAWSVHRVTKSLQAYFGLHTAYRAVFDGLSAMVKDAADAAA